jgi:predicted Rossmann fold flavoprotein
VAIIGGGAAGLAAAISAKEHSQDARIYLLDGARSLGAKILVSGGGRCNVTHDGVTPKDFFGNRHIVRNILAAFSVEQTIAWFTSLGVELKREETGKMFPTTDKARTVLTALLARARDSGVTVCPDHRVSEVLRSGSGFEVRHRDGLLHAARLILATGGQSLPKTGSDGFGYRLARFLGHHVTPTVPALVPLLLHRSMFHTTLSGLSQKVTLTTLVDGQEVDRRIQADPVIFLKLRPGALPRSTGGNTMSRQSNSFGRLPHKEQGEARCSCRTPPFFMPHP